MDTSKQIYFVFYLIAIEIKKILFVEDSCLERSIYVRWNQLVKYIENSHKIFFTAQKSCWIKRVL